LSKLLISEEIFVAAFALSRHSLRQGGENNRRVRHYPEHGYTECTENRPKTDAVQGA